MQSGWGGWFPCPQVDRIYLPNQTMLLCILRKAFSKNRTISKDMIWSLFALALLSVLSCITQYLLVHHHIFTNLPPIYWSKVWFFFYFFFFSPIISASNWLKQQSSNLGRGLWVSTPTVFSKLKNICSIASSSERWETWEFLPLVQNTPGKKLVEKPCWNTMALKNIKA